MKHYEFEINLLIDGELPENAKDELFTHLSTCRECQNSLSQYLLLKEQSREFCIQKINKLKPKDVEKINYYKIPFYISAAAAIILIFLFIGIKTQTTYITQKYVKVDTVFVSSKNKTLVHLQKEIPPMNKVKKESAERIPDPSISYLFNLQSEKITDVDLVKNNNRSLQ
jgi:hypothetical protein